MNERNYKEKTKPFFSLETATAEAAKQTQIMKTNKCVFSNQRPCRSGLWETGRQDDKPCHWNQVCASAAIAEARAWGRTANTAPVKSDGRPPAPSSPRTGPTPSPVPVPPPKCTGMKKAATLPPGMPRLPAGHSKTGVLIVTQNKIQDWLLKKIKTNKELYKYSKDQDAFFHYRKPGDATTNPDGKFRQPKTERDFMMLGYFQYQCRALMCAVRAEMPDSGVAKRLSRNFARALVGIDVTGAQGYMRPGNPGAYGMSVDIKKSVAKTHNIIAHEMAHCALSPYKEAGITTAHNMTHSNLWRQFIRIGIKRLGWEFVEFTYPMACLGYNICDLRDMDQTRVYNEYGLPSFGTKFLGDWAD
jgi:hypothetical protein